MTHAKPRPFTLDELRAYLVEIFPGVLETRRPSGRGHRADERDGAPRPPSQGTCGPAARSPGRRCSRSATPRSLSRSWARSAASRRRSPPAPRSISCASPRPPISSAEATLIKLGQRLAVGEVALYSEGESEMVAHWTGTYSIPARAGASARYLWEVSWYRIARDAAIFLTISGASRLTFRALTPLEAPPPEIKRTSSMFGKTHSTKTAEVEKKWLLIDAKGLVVGRLASIVAMRLRGKHKPSFTPHMDDGDNVIVINADKIVLTGTQARPEGLSSLLGLYRRHQGALGQVDPRGQVPRTHRREGGRAHAAARAARQEAARQPARL